MEVNLNDFIKVKLTEYGEHLYRSHFLRFRMKPIEKEKDANGYVKFLLWDFINIFGENIHPCMPNVIDPLDIIILDEWNEVRHK